MHRPMLLALAPMKDVTDLAFLNTLKDLEFPAGLFHHGVFPDGGPS